MQGNTIPSQSLGAGHPPATDLLSPMVPLILKRPSIENTTFLMFHPDAIDRANALLDYRPSKTKHKLIFLCFNKIKEL
jgi:hypothetical protein